MRKNDRGMVLVVCMWVIFSLTAAVLAFGSNVMLNYRRRGNTAFTIQAKQAANGFETLLKAAIESVDNGEVPDEEVLTEDEYTIGELKAKLLNSELECEAAKLDLNSVTRNMLLDLPGVTAEVASAIIDWRDEDDTVSEYGAEVATYSRLEPARLCKNEDFETNGELAMVYGMTTDLLYGKDKNQNGIVDEWEESNPSSYDFGLYNYLTVYSGKGIKATDGEDRVDINSNNLRQLIQQKLEDKASQVIDKVRPGQTQYDSIMALYLESGLEAEDFKKIEPWLTTGEDTPNPVYINGAGADVLAAIPGIESNDAENLIAWREANPDSLDSVTWVLEVLDKEKAREAGPWLSVYCWQYKLDMVIYPEKQRPFYRRITILDTSQGTTTRVYSRSANRFGWPMEADLDTQATVKKLY